MALTLFNTLTRQKELFTPLSNGPDRIVGMYNCGPTVYNYTHIGNLRQYIFADTIRRTLELHDYAVRQVVNITDVGHLVADADDGEDKMTTALKREGKPLTLAAMREVADFYTERFVEDLVALNIELPTVMPRASDHIAEDIAVIEQLEVKGFTYTTKDGVYFNTDKDPEYGKLNRKIHSGDGTDTDLSADGNTADNEEEHSRIRVNKEKKNFRDFSLWKFDENLGWNSPWGKGFPGWHIECSGMAIKYLGEAFDIHTGGIDHIPIHHTNEIAQSENATGKPFARFWMHGAFVNIGTGEKMAKSGENFLRLQTLVDRGIEPLAYRYWLLTAHYRSPINFSFEAVHGAAQALERIRTFFLDLPAPPPKQSTHHGSNSDEEIMKPDIAYRAEFNSAIDDDLNTPQAIAVLWQLIKDPEIGPESKRATMLYFDRVLGLNFAGLTTEIIPEEILKLIREREDARRDKDFVAADLIRDKIAEAGYQIRDTDNGVKVEKTRLK